MAVKEQDAMEGSTEAAPSAMAQSADEMARQVASQAAAQTSSMNINLDAALYATAQERNLGELKTDEQSFEFDGKQYVAQGFSDGILYAEVGNWGDIKQVAW